MLDGGREVSNERIETTPSALRKLAATLRPDDQVVLEATVNTWRKLAVLSWHLLTKEEDYHWALADLTVFEIFAYRSVTDFIGVHLGGIGTILDGLWNIGDVEVYLGLAVAGAFYVLRGADPIPALRRTARRLAGSSRQ